jgi:hypothetical protein
MRFNSASKLFRGALRDGFSAGPTKDFLRSAGYVADRLGMGGMLAGIYARQAAGRFTKNAGAYIGKNRMVATGILGAGAIGAGVGIARERSRRTR